MKCWDWQSGEKTLSLPSISNTYTIYFRSITARPIVNCTLNFTVQSIGIAVVAAAAAAAAVVAAAIGILNYSRQRWRPHESILFVLEFGSTSNNVNNLIYSWFVLDAVCTISSRLCCQRRAQIHQYTDEFRWIQYILFFLFFFISISRTYM